jgi:gliding motility-associated-like protein
MRYFIHILSFAFLCLVSASEMKADNIYIMNAPGYNTAQPDLIAAMQSLGHTVTINSTDFATLPPGFTSYCINPNTGYHWLCFFGELDFSYLAPEVSVFIANGGKVYYNYEVSCCTQSSQGAASMVAAVTGLPVTPSAVDYVAISGGGTYGWEAVIPGCFTIYGNAFKPLDGLPLANQLVATGIGPGAAPDLSSGSNFGFFFTGDDIPGNTLNGSLTGMGDINMWYGAAEPTAFPPAPIAIDLVAYFFPNETTTCHLATSGCASACPFTTVLGPDDTICEDEPLTLDATSPTATEYLWFDNTTAATKQINQPGIYWVEVTDGTETCRDSIEITEIVVVVDAGLDVVLCPGSSTSLLATGATTYSWLPGGSLNNASIPNPEASPIITTTYTVTGTMDGCTDTDDVIVTIDPIDVDYDVSLTPEVCETPGTFMIENVSGSSPFYVIELNGAAINENEVYDVPAGNYELIISDENSCQAIEDIVVSSNDPLISWTSTSSNPRCDTEGEIIVENVQGGVGPYTYKLNNNLQDDGTFEGLSFGAFTVRITDQNGCEASQIYNLIDQPNEITATVATVDAICETPGKLLSVAVANAVAPITYEVDSQVYFNQEMDIDTSLHTLVVRDVDGCEFTQTFQVQNINVTEAVFTADPYITKAPAEITLTNSSLNATSYRWDFGNGEFSTDENEKVTYLEPGDYNVVLTATDDVNGCVDTMLYIIYVAAPNSVYIPNTFTPDYDGINDVFRIEGENIDANNFTFTVFNRWGDAVWTSVDPTQVWTGSYKDGAYFLPDGVYPFLLNYRFTDSADQQTMSGHIQIIR